MLTNVEIELSDESAIELDVGIASQYSEESPPVIRLGLRNRTEEELRIRSGEPAPLGDNRSKEGPEHVEFQPTRETEREHDFARYPQPIAKREITDGSECWVVVDGYGPGRQMLVATIVEPQQTLTFDYGLVTLRSADRCLPPGTYLFEDSFTIVHGGREIYDRKISREEMEASKDEVAWTLQVEIGQ